MVTFGDIRKATLAARYRTGDTAIGTQVKAGRFQVVRVVFGAKGASKVTALSDYLSPADAVKFLDELGGDWGAAVLAVGAL